MFRYARILDEEIKRQRAKTVFYLTWARQEIPEMQEGADPAKSPAYAKATYQIGEGAGTLDLPRWCEQRRIGLAGGLNGAYFDLARELRATAAAVGVAWNNALAADPKLVLHQADKSHPNPNGINNLISLETLHSAGTFDLDQIQPPVVFRPGLPGESYAGIGRGEIKIEGLPIFADSVGPFGSTTSDSERTMVRLETSKIMMVVISFIGAESMDGILRRAAGLLHGYASATTVETWLAE